MKQIQTIVLEKEDMTKLKEGETLVIKLSDGKSIELVYSEGHKPTSKNVNGNGSGHGEEEGTMIEEITNLIVKPMTVREIVKQVHKPVQSVRGAVVRLVNRNKAKAVKAPGHAITYQAVEA